MNITLSPQFCPTPLVVERLGDTLMLNGVAFDFGPLPEGAELPAEAIGSDWFTGTVQRIGGALHLTLILPHGANAPEATRFPVPLVLTDDGPVVLPAFDEQTAEEGSEG